MLVFSRVGARSSASDSIEAQIEAVVELSNEIQTVDRLGPVLGGVAGAFDIDEIRIVTVSDTGEIRDRATRGNRGSAIFELSDRMRARYAADETVIVDRDNQVVGLRQLEFGGVDRQIQLPPNITIGVLIAQDVAPIPRSAFRWFLISALLVLGLSSVVAVFLSRRLVGPLRSIEATTASIAAGNLEARADVEGPAEMAQLAESVNKMAADIDRSRAVEQQFLLSVSHDLRTPLTAIQGYAEALTDGATEDPADAGRIIGTHADRLGRLVRDLLDLARLDAKAFSFDVADVELSGLVAETVDGLQPVADRYGIALQQDVPEDPSVHRLVVYADRGRLGQITDNLVENALKFAHSTVTIRLTEHTEAGWVELSVIDDGPGIDDADLPHVFERLYVTQQQPLRAESSSGLGLAIVRELTEAMGGSVRATAGIVNGTEMTVRLPTGS